MGTKKFILLALVGGLALGGLACGVEVTVSELDDGSRVLFVGDLHNKFGHGDEIYSVNADGSDVQQHTFGCDHQTPETYCYYSAPSVSPDGTRLAYALSNHDIVELSGIYTQNLDGTDLKLFIPGGQVPTWSPDGKRLAFTKATFGLDNPIYFRGTSYEIFVINADGTGERQITDLNGGYFLPAPECSENDGGVCVLAFTRSLSWSPDGKQIVFGSGLYGNIYTVSVDGELNSGLKPLLDPDDRRFNELTWIGTDRFIVRNPSWSPDGKKIAFHARTGGRISDNDAAQIYVVNPDGTAAKRIGNGWHPSWSPDGQHLLFWSLDGPGGRNWFYREADGGSNKVSAITQNFFETGKPLVHVDSGNRAVWYIPAPADASVSN